MSDYELYNNSTFQYSEDVEINIPIGIIAVADSAYPDGARIKLVRPTEGTMHNTHCCPEDFKVLSSHRINDILEKTGACYAVIVLDSASYSTKAAEYLKSLQQTSLDFLIPDSSPVIRTSISRSQQEDKLYEYFIFPSTEDRRASGIRIYNALLTYISRQIIFLKRNNLKEVDQCIALRNIVRTLQAMLPEFLTVYDNSPEFPLEKMPEPATESTQTCLHEAMDSFLRLLDMQRRKLSMLNPGTKESNVISYMGKALVTLCEYVNMVVKKFNEKLAESFDEFENSVPGNVKATCLIARTNYLEKLLVPYIRVAMLMEAIRRSNSNKQ